MVLIKKEYRLAVLFSNRAAANCTMEISEYVVGLLWGLGSDL